MNEKSKLIQALADELQKWDYLLNALSEKQIIAPNPITHMPVKDIIAHLTAWQQISVARMEAAAQDRQPQFPWPPQFEPDTDDGLDEINAWIYETYRAQSWHTIHNEWKERFQRFLELSEAIPEDDLFEVGKYPWLKDYPLSAVLESSYNHHEEHYEELLPLLNRDKK